MHKEDIVFLVVVCLVLFAFFAFASSLAHADDHPESWYVEKHCSGEIKPRFFNNTKPDCVIEKYAIEYDFSHKWAEAIGQSLYYAARSGKKPGIVIIGDTRHDEAYLARLFEALNEGELHIRVWVISR